MRYRYGPRVEDKRALAAWSSASHRDVLDPRMKAGQVVILGIRSIGIRYPGIAEEALGLAPVGAIVATDTGRHAFLSPRRRRRLSKLG